LPLGLVGERGGGGQVEASVRGLEIKVLRDLKDMTIHDVQRK